MKTNLQNYLNKELKKLSYYKDLKDNEALSNIMNAALTLKYYINFHSTNEELEELLFEIVENLTAEDY